MYRLIQNGYTQQIDTVFDSVDNLFIPFDPANTDYENFKQQINDDTAQLETVDGTLMTPEEAKAYVATLP